MPQQHIVLKRRGSDVDGKEEKLKSLRLAAELYARADKELEVVCGEHTDPIACRVFALKKRNVDCVPGKLCCCKMAC